jgi:hypothetical protein
LFTIRVRTAPLADIAAHPPAVRDLLRALALMSADERTSFGCAHHGPALEAWLRSLLADQGAA